MECNIAREQVESIHKEGWDATMKLFTFVELMLMAFIMISSAVVHAGIEPIKTVEIGKNREIRVNGKPFLPIMAWLQDPKNFETVKQCGMNVIAGYWSGSGGTKDVSEYLELVAKAGLYGVMPFDPKLKGHPMLLGYIHPDEPDLLRKISDARVEHAPYMRINRRTPLWKLVDGDVFSWSVFDPLEGAWVTIHLKKPATIHSIAVWLTVSSGLSLAKEVAFKADGREILRVTLEPRRGRQQFKLKRPVTLQRLTMKVLKVTRGKNIYGSFSEIEAFDANGRNVLLVRPKSVPRLTPEEVMERYRDIKRQDATRPVFMTLTGCFHPHFKKWGERREEIYRKYVQAADVVGYDIYPIYGWNKPEWIYLVHDATALLTGWVGNRPVYAWIETSKGGQWTGPLSRQKDVTPKHIKAEVWMAICAGATAIGYFTHIWKPRYMQFGVPQRNRIALAEINAQLKRLAPAILSAPPKRRIAMRSDGDVKLDFIARQYGGEIYIFAVNYDERLKEAQVKFEVEGLRSGQRITVVDEHRTLTAQAGWFEDTFAPLAVHIYKMR